MENKQTMRECQENLKEEGYNKKEAKNICRKKRGFEQK